MNAEPSAAYRAAGLTAQDMADPFGLAPAGRAGELAAKLEPLNRIWPLLNG
jgi:hypothetical protein